MSTSPSPSARLREKEGLLASYGRRTARPLTERKQTLMETLLPALRVPLHTTLDLHTLFPDAHSYWLEIGFGGGEHLAEQAKRNPQVGIIGCEPFVDGVAKLVTKVDEDGLSNVRLWDDDARILMDAIPDASLERVFILFPDPWPKAKHHKRRIVNPDTLDMLARIMKQGAELLLATDHVAYSEWMIEKMTQDARFYWTAETPQDWKTPPSDWVKTRYQEKAEKQGRSAVFLRYVKL